MPPARRRPRHGGAPAGGGDGSVPSSAADLLALAATLIRAASTTTLKAAPQLKQLVHSLPASHPLLLSLPQALTPPSDPDPDAGSASDAPPPLRPTAVLLHLLVTHPTHPPRWDDLICPLALLHGRLALLATADPPVAALAASCFELAWRAEAPGREALVAQTLPYLVALALTSGASARPVLRRLFAFRDALPLLDYDDQSISDFKALLLRCFVSPLFLMSEEGREFLVLVLGLSEGIAREGLELIRKQVGMPGTKRAAVVAYGEVTFRAWKDWSWVRGEVVEAFLQGMVEGAVRAGNKEVAKPARKILSPLRYLDHLDENDQNMSCFLWRMTANCKHSMVVPKRFLKHFDGNLSGTIKLESPNHGQYDVRVTKCFDKVEFRHGWGEFVDFHGIEENDYLLFRHIDKSWFEVSILDSNGCEKVFPCAEIRHARRFQEDIPSKKTSLEPDDLQTPLMQDYVLSNRSYLSEAQEKSVIALIQEIQPESTVFIAVMRKSHVETPRPYLDIPKGYALAYFPHESMHITLQMPGKSKKWHPKFYKGNDKRLHMLRGQWLDFVRENHVKEGDICLLFPTKAGRRYAFTVYLVCAAATHSWGATYFERVGPCLGRSSTKMPCEIEEPTGENLSSEGNMCETSHESVDSDSCGPSEPPYIVSSKTDLSQSQKRIVEEGVRSIESEVPIFVVVTNKSNVAATHSSVIVVRARLNRGSWELLVQWEGRAAAEASWELVKDFKECYPQFPLADELFVGEEGSVVDSFIGRQYRRRPRYP